MSYSRWAMRTAAALTVGVTLAGCCVAPVGPYGPRYGGRVMYEPVPVVVAPPPPPRHWRWYR